MARPDFTGIWKWSREQSVLQIPPPDWTIFVIEHEDPRFHLERTHSVSGVSDTLSMDLKAGADPLIQMHGNVEICARLYWDGDCLVCDSILRRGSEQGTNIVRYQLADEGRTFIASETLTLGAHSHENLWVFQRE